MKNFTILSFFMSFAFVVAFIIVGFIQSTIILDKITNETILKVEQDLKKLITPIETSLKIVSKLNKIDHLRDMDTDNINQVLIPIFEDFPEITAFKMAGQDHSVYILHRTESGWAVGKQHPKLLNGKARWQKFNKFMAEPLEHENRVPIKFDKTEWFQKTINAEPNQILWSEPHLIVGVNAIGITVSLPVKRGNDETIVFAFDIALSSLSDLLTNVLKGNQGTPFIISNNKRYLISANNFVYDSELKKADNKPNAVSYRLQEYVNTAVEYWEENKMEIQKKPQQRGIEKELFFFKHGEQSLIGNLKYITCGTNLSFWVGVILDEDKNIMIKRDLDYLVTIPIILILALVIAFLMAHSMTKRYTVPIRQLVERSSQIARMKLDEAEPIRSPIVELQQLADSQEKMRVELKQATEKLEEWGNTCSMQVIERTKEVEAKSVELEKVNIELEKLNKNLEKRVAEEVAASSRKDKIMFQSARQAQMGEMLSMIAHQWRQPLSSISTITGSMLVYLELGTFEQEQFKELLNDINSHAQYLSGTINDFRNFFKPNKDKQPAILSEIMDQSINIIGKSLDYKSIKINREYQPVSEIMTFPNELMQVFLNIIKNAQDVLLERKIESPAIDISVYFEDDYQVVEIMDNAGGIPEENLAKVFEPYFSTKDEKTGTGLGLYMSKLIIEKHCNGQLILTNNENGANFKILIPTNPEN